MKLWSNSEVHANGPYVPEKRLLAAVLQRAITDFLTGEGEIREGAREWLVAAPQDVPLTFEFICEALDLDIDSLRMAILAHAENQSQFVIQEAAI